MIDFTKPIETTDGKPARVLCTDLAGRDYPVIAAVQNGFGAEDVFAFTTKGVARIEGVPDLRNVAPKPTVTRCGDTTRIDIPGDYDIGYRSVDLVRHNHRVCLKAHFGSLSLTWPGVEALRDALTVLLQEHRS